MSARVYVEEILKAVAGHEPISPWELHHHCSMWKTGPEGLRVALRAVMQAGWVMMGVDGMLVATSDMPDHPGDGAPVSSPGGDGQETSTSHPTPGPETHPPLRLVPTVPSTSAHHSASQTGSRTHALYCAIQIGAASLSRLEDELRKFLEAESRPGGDTVRRAASALWHKASAARQEYELSSIWLQETLAENTEQ